jgi:hypothetical protein
MRSSIFKRLWAARALLEGGVIAAVDHQRLTIEVHDVIAHRVEEVAVVRDQQQGAGIAGEPLLEPQQRIQVQVVGGLVEQQQIGRLEQRARQVDAHAPAAREGRQRPVQVGLEEAQTHQQLGGAGRGAVAVQRLDGAVQFGLAMGVFALTRLLEGHLGAAQLAVAIEHIVDDGAVKGLHLLIHMGDALAAAHLQLALVRGQLAEQQLEQAGLARAVGPDDPRLVAGMQGQVGSLQQGLGAALQGNLAQCDHAGSTRQSVRPPPMGDSVS